MNQIQTHSCDVVVGLKNGIHLSPAAQIVKTAQAFRSTFSIHKGDRVVDGKSMFDMLTLAAEFGTHLRLVAMGDDAPEALAAIEALFANNFALEGISGDRVVSG